MNMIICRHSIQFSYAITVHVEATQHAFVQVDKARLTFRFKDSSETFGHNTHSIPEELMVKSGEHLAAAAPLVTGRPVLASLTPCLEGSPAIPLVGAACASALTLAAAAASEVASKNSLAVGLVKPG